MKTLHEIIEYTTCDYRKQQETVTNDGAATHLWLMPHESEAPADLELVDLHFIKVGVSKSRADEVRDELIEHLNAYSQPERLASGPSYIEVGAEIGDQGAALRLFALGKVLGLWDVITPATLGATGAMADQMAGSGFVMCSGYRRPAVAETTP